MVAVLISPEVIVPVPDVPTVRLPEVLMVGAVSKIVPSVSLSIISPFCNTMSVVIPVEAKLSPVAMAWVPKPMVIPLINVPALLVILSPLVVVPPPPFLSIKRPASKIFEVLVCEIFNPLLVPLAGAAVNPKINGVVEAVDGAQFHIIS